MNARTFLTRTPVVAAALAVGLWAADPPRAQAQAERWLYVSTNAKELADQEPAASIANLLLRPNIEEAFYLYVRNPTGRDQPVTVVIASAPEGGEIARVALPVVAAGKTVRVLPPKPEPLPAGAKPVPPPVTELSDGLYLRRLDANGQVAEKLLLPVSVQVPAQYVEASPRIEGEPGSGNNRLLVTLKDLNRNGRPFTGPPARVRLDLSPARIPALIPDSIRERALESFLPPGGVATLMAANPRFRSGVNPRGVFTISVDRYDRAFLFETDFSGTIPQPMRETALRLAGPAYAIPGKPCPIRLEVDNPPPGEVFVEFGIDRANAGTFDTDRPLAGDRMRKAAVRWGWEAAVGGLQFVTEAGDWVKLLDTAGLSGSRRLRLRLLDKAGLELAPPVYDTIVFDETSPEEVRFDELGKAIRNRMLDVAAFGTDPESKVARVVFFLGEPPTPDGKPAPGGRVVEGAPPEEDGAPYTGRLQLPDRTGRIPIGVRFINNVGLARDVTDEIEVFDPPPKPTTGAIKVTVVQGTSTKPRPQEGATVELRDGMNKTVLKTGAANAKGEFTFEELAPGKYVVFSSRPMDFTKAQQLVTVTAGETTTANLTLVR